MVAYECVMLGGFPDPGGVRDQRQDYLDCMMIVQSVVNELKPAL